MEDSNQELPLLTELAEDASSDELPILFEIVADTDEHLGSPPADSKPVRALNAEEMQQLLQQIEVHLETVFTQKLNKKLEELQRLAVDLAVSEFKAELPQLLREALNKTDISGK